MGTIGRLFSFQGRFNRGQYIAVFFASLAGLVLGPGVLLTIVDASLGPSNYETVGRHQTIEFIVTLPWVVVMIWISLANLAKRFHDINWNGAACLLTFIPLVGLVFAIVMMFVPGTRGPNFYGDQPGAPAPIASLR